MSQKRNPLADIIMSESRLTVNPLDIFSLNSKVSTREICDYYGQNYDNIRHMKKFIKQLKNRYKNEGSI